NERDVAELAAGGLGSLLAGHAGGDQLLCSFVDVLFDGDEDVVVAAAARRQRSDPFGQVFSRQPHGGPPYAPVSASTRVIPWNIRSNRMTSCSRWRMPASVAR